MAPFSFSQCRAAEVSSPPEKAMPTFWPMGSDSRITDMLRETSQWSLNREQSHGRSDVGQPPMRTFDQAQLFPRSRSTIRLNSRKGTLRLTELVADISSTTAFAPASRHRSAAPQRLE